MKRTCYYFIATLLLISPLSCNKDEATPSSSLATTPEAEAAEDDKSGGVYKGTLIGSTGIIKITLQKGVKEMKITLDGVSKTLTTTSLASWTTGQAIVSAAFSSGDWSSTFDVNETGTSFDVGLSIPGHPDISGVIVKEKSTGMVKAYEGTYTGTSSGTWNFIEKNGVVMGVSKESGGTTSNYFEGTVSGNTISIPNVSAAGSINGNSCSGTWQGGTWTGKRTL